MTFAQELLCLAGDVLAAARTRGVKLATAESCTGGLIAGLLTEIAGSSDVFERGFVTYSNEAKQELLGVPPELLEEHGAVSHEVAFAMSVGALRHSLADYAIAVTGIAGPGGGSAQKPVGLVYIAISGPGAGSVTHHEFGDIGRSEVRLATMKAALELLMEQL
jgi:nicotinamide-nucleotide amidase